jgi:hypothetical protein
LDRMPGEWALIIWILHADYLFGFKASPMRFYSEFQSCAV